MVDPLLRSGKQNNKQKTAIVLILASWLCPLVDLSADPAVIRIGTGGSTGTYLQIGSIIATALSTSPDPVNASNTDHKTINILAVAQRSTGSEGNVNDMHNGLLEAALVQADVVYRAFNDTKSGSTDIARSNLRGIASLYLESVHLVVRNGSGIRGIEDLANKRVSLDEQGSGTRLGALSILTAYNLETASFKPVYLKTPDAIDRLLKDQLDAFFVVAGYPINAVSKLVADGDATVVPIAGQPADTLIETYPYFSIDKIPRGVYANSADVPTLGVPAQLIIQSDIDDHLAYEITKRLWSDESMSLLSNGHPKGRDVQLRSALVGMDVPLHPGAARYYRENDVLTE